jgi:hypothetical protein
MSFIKLQSNVAGTGIITLTSLNTNTDSTITLPDQTGTLLTSDLAWAYFTTPTATTGVSIAGNYTGITVGTSTTVAAASSSGTGANRPLYYALAFIMKT